MIDIRPPKPRPSASAPEPESTPSAPPAPPKEHLWNKMGPGLITGASDDDPSGIATYSIAGAQFGYSTLWLSLFAYPLAAAVQELCARIGIVTGHGLATTTKRHYGKAILAIAALLLFAANTINVGADIQAMSSTVSLLVPGIPYLAIALAIVVITLLALVYLSYRTYAKFLKYATITLLSYVFVALLSSVDWHAALHDLVVPSLSLNPIYLMTLVGILGTTISPYMFFWQASEEVEEEVSKGVIRKDDPTTNHPNLLKQDPRIIKDMRFDVFSGMFYSQLIMYFIITATAATLFKTTGGAGVADLTLDQLASVLRPLVGDTAFFLFTLGILGTGFLAIPVLAGSASYAIAELFDWKEGLNKRLREARGFYVVIILSVIIGLLLNQVGVSPVSALYYTAIINGLVAVPILVIIWRIGNDRRILGDHTSGPLSNFLMITTILVMMAAAGAMLFYH